MRYPNRIRHFRRLAGLSASQLAECAGTLQAQISRLERGERQLTVKWMMQLAPCLECAPEDLLGPVALASIEDDATRYTSDKIDGLDAALERTGIVLYVAGSQALANLGITPREPVPFDLRRDAIDGVQTGDIVLVEITWTDDEGATGQKLVMRQFIAPDLLTTNRPGRNLSFHLTEEGLAARLLGVHRIVKSNGHG